MEYHGEPVGGSARRWAAESWRTWRAGVGWSRSTTLTMLKRMTEKGLIACEDNGRMRVYAPLVEREAAVKKETDNFLKRVYNGSASMLVSSFIKRQRLSAEELSELRQILDKAEEEHNG